MPDAERDGDRYVLSSPPEVLRYDPEQGSLDTLLGGVVREQLLVRQGLVEEVTRAAVVVELRRLGYRVDEPGAVELPRRVDREAREVYVEVERDAASLAAARVGLEHVEHHGRPLRFAGSSYAGDTITHRFRCRDDACPFVLAWSVTS